MYYKFNIIQQSFNMPLLEVANSLYHCSNWPIPSTVVCQFSKVSQFSQISQYSQVRFSQVNSVIYSVSSVSLISQLSSSVQSVSSVMSVCLSVSQHNITYQLTTSQSFRQPDSGFILVP